jgi:homoserine kinase
MNEIKIFCPATIANLSCGFDVLVVLDNVGDEDYQKIRSKKSTKIVGADLPLETEKRCGCWTGFAVRLKPILVLISKFTKNKKAGSGIGNSAAST